MTALNGIRVLDVTDGLGESCARFLGDLGADVLRVELPGGSRSRQAAPLHHGVSIPFALRNSNKRGVIHDLTEENGRAQLHKLAADCDILIESQPPGWFDDHHLSFVDLLATNPTLVVVSVSGFGQTGPYRDWQATEAVIYALGGVLSRSGIPGAAPLLPPTGLVEGSVGIHAAWSALLGLHERMRTGRGQHIDISALEVVVHGFDPGFGVQGSAAAGRAEDFPRGRPEAANFYPVYRCADGQVRICLLARRQWRAMFEWLGAPADFADPLYDTIPARFAASDRLNPLIESLFASYTRDELVAEGAARGIPIGGVLTLGEVISEEHFRAAGTFIDAAVADGVQATIPNGYARLDGQRAGYRHRAPHLDENCGSGWEDTRRLPAPALGRAAAARPFEGLRVLDLGVVVFGAELSRQFADFGADVIKIENAAFPDGLRQSKRGASLAASVAWGHRNKRSLGLNLRAPYGRELFLRLVADADVVLANFKPGTLSSMGLSYQQLADINPAIIVAESSAFGSVGPWNTRLGYGPLVRAACGVSALWRNSAVTNDLCDGSTVYPDHIAAQATAVTVLAALIARARTAAGMAVEVAQADVAVTHLGIQLVLESMKPKSVSFEGNYDPFAAPAGVYACAGDDEWCAVTVRDDHDWQSLCAAMGDLELAMDPRFATTERRIDNRNAVEGHLAAWLAARGPDEAMETLQKAGVPAGAMRRLPDLLTDPQLLARNAYTQLEHPLLLGPLPAAARVAQFETIPDADMRPAPVFGAHTVEVASELLGLTGPEIDRLIADGVLQHHLSAREAVTPVGQA